MPQYNQTAYGMHRNSFELEGSALSFHDPFNGEPLMPDRPPLSMEMQRGLKSGFDYLRQRGESLSITVYGSSHAANSEHNMAELVRDYSLSDAIFLEGLDHNEESRTVLWDIASGSKSELNAQEVATTTPYQRQQFAALLGCHRPAFYADIPSDGGEYEQSLKQWNDLFESFDSLAGDSDGKTLAKCINLAGTTIMREWYMLASLGKDLRVLDFAGYQAHKPLIHIGTNHVPTLTQKAKSLGVTTQVITPKLYKKEDNPGKNLRIPFSFAEAVGRCATTVDWQS